MDTRTECTLTHGSPLKHRGQWAARYGHGDRTSENDQVHPGVTDCPPGSTLFLSPLQEAHWGGRASGHTLHTITGDCADGWER
jgi:hypothetical protein